MGRGFFGVYKLIKMKKLLLTLLAVAAVFVACNKDELGTDSSSINALEQSEEVSSVRSVDLLNNIEGILQSVEGISQQFDYKGLQAPSTARNIGSGLLEISLHAFGGSDYLVLQGGDADDICRDNAGIEDLGKIAFRKTSSTNFEILVFIDATNTIVAAPTNALTSGLEGLFTLASIQGITSISQVNERLFPLATRISIGDAGIACSTTENIWEESDSTPGLWEHDLYGSYQLSSAPFPLTGVLARVMSDETSSDDTNNYAASGSYGVSGVTDNVQAVRDAIEADFERE